MKKSKKSSNKKTGPASVTLDTKSFNTQESTATLEKLVAQQPTAVESPEKTDLRTTLKNTFTKIITKLTPKKRESSADAKVSASGNKLDKHILGEIGRINREKQERKKKSKIHPNMFTLRGLIRAINLQSTLEKAGFDNVDPKILAKRIVQINLAIFSFLSLYLLIAGIMEGANIYKLLSFIFVAWVAFFFLGIGIIFAIYLFYLDMKIYQRTVEVEKVFPDFLQLASSNISAGMPIDRALWYAVRPNFGVLAKEIEHVAKNTLTGQDLSEALQEFARKYDSKVIQRSTSLLLEGLAAGGELAELLNKIALNIEETRILKRDMAANVTTYVIFITFASIVAAPALLGLSTQLLEIISKITSSIATENPGSSTGMISLSFSGDSMSVSNFKIFSYVMLTISSISAACIVNIIQTGRVKDGLSKIPIFIAVSCGIYLASSALMSYMFSGII